MRRCCLVVPLFVLAACAAPGPTSASRPSAPPAASPGVTATSRVPSEPLFVVLESSSGSLLAPDTIAIAGLDGYARAKTRFKPHAAPWVLPDLSPLVPQIAHVAAGRAYYVDGDGVVRSLGVDGSVREETRFPVTSSQQEVSFAVSPDGRSLVGSVVTLPSEPTPAPTPGYIPTTPISMDVLTATAGSAASVADHQTWSFQGGMGSGAQFVGWDGGGPVATWPSGLGTQGGGPHQWNGVTLVHFAGGRPGAAVAAPAGCFPMDLLPTGVFACGRGDPTIRVLGPDGGEVWRLTASDAGGAVTYGFLSPDAQRVVALGMRTTVYSRSGAPVVLPDSFFHSGWIDSQTIAGSVGTASDFGYVALGNPGHAVDLGFKGQFVGGLLT